MLYVQKALYVQKLNINKKRMASTVKARRRQGTNSLDITIPTSIVRDEKINVGDIFEVELNKQNNELKLEYKRVYKKK